MIEQIKLRFSSAYLVLGDRPVLVDTGSPGEADAIVTALARRGLHPRDLALVLHTHVHGDHVGSTAALLAHTEAPTAYHHADNPIMARGNNGPLNGVGLRGRVMARFFRHGDFPTFTPTFHVEHEQRLDGYGVAGQILHAPGHTAGSISLLLDSGEAIIGDVLMGGYLGGNLLPHRPMPHYFAEDIEQIYQSLHRILAHDPHTLYVGHGGPLRASRVRRWLMQREQVV